MPETQGDCSRCFGERGRLCNSFFYEAAAETSDNTDTVEALKWMGDERTASDYQDDFVGEPLSRLTERMNVIGCGLNPAEIQVKMQERIDSINEGIARKYREG